MKNKTNKCTDRRGNELCTNGKDTYHEWNSKYGSCGYCGYSENDENDDGFCKCDRCDQCGKIIKE